MCGHLQTVVYAKDQIDGKAKPCNLCDADVVVDRWYAAEYWPLVMALVQYAEAQVALGLDPLAHSGMH